MKPMNCSSPSITFIFLLLLFSQLNLYSQNVSISGLSPVSPGAQETYTANFNYSVDPLSIIYWTVSGGTIISQNTNAANPPIYCTVQWSSTPGSGSIAVYEDLNSGQADRNVDIICGEADGGPNRTICLGGSVVIGIPGLPGYSYSWSPSTGLNNPNIAQPTASPTSSTSYTVTMTGNGCAATHTSVLVTVNPLPTISPSGPIVKCVQYETGNWLTLTTNLTNNIQWKDNGSILTNETSSTVVLINNPNCGGSWPTCGSNITVTNTLTGCISNPVQVTRKNFMSPQLHTGNDPYYTPSEYCASTGGMIQQVPSLISGTVFWWNVTDPFGNPATGISISPNNSGNRVATITFPSYAYNTATIEARAIDNGCDGATDNDWHQIYTINIDHSCKSNSQITNPFLSEQPVSIFPNPAKQYITVKSIKAIVSLEILDMNQNFSILRKKIANKTTDIIDVSRFRKGIYICKIVTVSGISFLKLQIIE